MNISSIRFFLRCIALTTLILGKPAVTTAQPESRSDRWLTQPVDDATFNTYLDFFAYDKNLPLELKVGEVTTAEGVKKEHLSFQSTPGVRVTAHFYVSSEATAPKRLAPAVIHLHGGGASGKDGASRVAPALVRAGFVVLAIDLQHFGERTTGLLTTFTEQDKHDRLYNQPSQYLAWVTQSVKDVGRSIDLLVAERGADPKRIGLMGTSRGAILAAIVGGAERRVAAVALLIGGHFDALEKEHLGPACPANYIGRISPRPLLTINGTSDTDMIRETSVLPLLSLAKEPKEIVWSDHGHTIVPDDAAILYRWLQEKLK